MSGVGVADVVGGQDGTGPAFPTPADMLAASGIDVAALYDAAPDEVVTHTHVRTVRLPTSGMTLALVTLDNGMDHTRPNTFGPRGLAAFGVRMRALAAEPGGVSAVALTGKPYGLAAGADLAMAGELRDAAMARDIARVGHWAFGTIRDLEVPTFCFIPGLAIGGGLELALHCDYRTLDAVTGTIGLPEVSLGLVPGWGGSILLPRLIGVERALRVVLSNPLRNNRLLRAADAQELGIVDALCAPRTFLEDSLRWAERVLLGAAVPRPHTPGLAERLAVWPVVIAAARRELRRSIGVFREAPFRALELVSRANLGSLAAGFAREEDALAALMTGDQLRSSLYAYHLVQRRSKRPSGGAGASGGSGAGTVADNVGAAPAMWPAPQPVRRPVTRIGVVGAGLMARQIALLAVRRLRVPVILTDIDADRVEAALTGIRADLTALQHRGRMSPDEVSRCVALLDGVADTAAFAGCDWIIEAVFEDLDVKRAVFAALEEHVPATTIFATNTSALSVAAIGAGLQHPERLVGFHVFNPVAIMPLVEVARTAVSDEAVLMTAQALARDLRKTPVLVADAPGFVVNRLLGVVLGEAARAVDAGVPVPVIESALMPMNLPMGPLRLLDLVGWRVAAHVQDTLAAAFPSRMYVSDNLRALAALSEPVVRSDRHGHVVAFTPAALAILADGRSGAGAAPSDRAAEPSPNAGADLLRRVEDALAREVRQMVDEGVVATVADIDACLILGAGWPLVSGGVSRYLDRVGASLRVNGNPFHPDA